MNEEIRRLIFELGTIDERRMNGLPPRSAEEAAQFLKLVLLHSMLDNVTFHYVNITPIVIPDTVPTEWTDQFS